jgi:hypothetical protein
MGSHSKVAGLPDLTDEKIWVGNPSNRPVEEDKPVGDLGLSYYGKVTTYTDTTHFKASALAGFGDTFFKGYFVYVVRDAGGAGAAPQFEQVEILDYTSTDGTFQHDAFTTSLAEDDEVLIVLLPAAVGDIGLSDQPMTGAPTEREGSGSYPTWTKLKEVRIRRNGDYRCKWESDNGSSGDRGSQIYVNGSPVGNNHILEGGPTAFTEQIEDVPNLVRGDLLQLYGDSSQMAVKNFAICGVANPYHPKVTQD